MIWVDYTILGIIGLSSLVSLMRGFVKEAMSLAVWIAAFFISSMFYEHLAVFLADTISEPLVRNGAAIAILFFSTLIVGSLVNYVLGELVQRTGLSGTDRIIGLVFGPTTVGILSDLFQDTMDMTDVESLKIALMICTTIYFVSFIFKKSPEVETHSSTP